MKFGRLIPLFFVIAAAFFTPLRRVDAQNRVDIWTTDNGLPQNSITSLTRTPDGYIWFTTNDGLVRFDGVRFKVFNKSNTPEITNNRMLGAFADKSGKLWAQTEDGGIFFYEKGIFKITMKPDERPPIVRSSFFDDPTGGVIFYVNYKHYHYRDGKFTPLQIDGLSGNSVIVMTDREGGLWFTGAKEIRRIKNGNIKTHDLSGFSTGEVFKAAYEDRQGGIWLGFADEQKQSLLRIKNDRVQSFKLPGSDDRVRRIQIPSAVSHFAEDVAGNLWISVYRKGIYRIDHKSVVADEPIADVLEPVLLIEDLSNISSGYLCPDREGGIWVGTEKGLIRILPQTIRVFSKQEGLPEDNVYPVYEDKAGGIWAGVWQNSLMKYENGSFKTFLRTKDTYFITSLFEDGSGRFWVGKIGILYYLENGKLVKFTERAGFREGAEFSVIAQDRDGNLWFGTDQGLSRYSSEKATVFTKKDGLPDDYIVAFLQTGAGKIWVGTRGGIASIENGAIKAFTVKDGLASNYIRSLYEDSTGVLWIGSYDGGLTRLKDGKFTRFTMNDGLSSNGVFCILEDNRGWFWMNSNQGIYRVSKQELNDFADGKIKSVTSIAYNKQDGLLNTEGNGGRQPAGVKAKDGRLWFPTAQGIAVVDPGAVTTNQISPPVLIEEIVIDRNPVENEKFQSAIGAQSEITLAPGQSNLEINYTGISFINSGQVKFKYRLEGLDRDWNEVGTRRTAYYSYLPPGEYTFHVIAANRDGVWNTEGARVKVRVLPPFYRTNWFILVCLAAVGFSAWAAYQQRVRQMKFRLNLQFEERLAERTRIAQELHDTLLQGFLSASMQLHVAVDNLPADAPSKPRLARVLELMGQVIEEGRNAVREIRSSHRDSLDLQHAFSRIRQEFPVHKEAGQEIGESTGFRVIVVGRPRPLQPVLCDEVYRIGREALINAFHHSRAKSIEVEVEYAAKHLRVLVRDDGCGIDPQVVRTGRDGHWGLTGMRERAERIGARFTLRSRVASGTEIELSVPGHIAFKVQSKGRPLRWFARLYPRKAGAETTIVKEGDK
jgi:ligand-binding sensor domain-containing protein/signal transduction histidine kinase